MRLAIPFAEIFFVHQGSVAHDEQASVLAGFFFELKRLIQLLNVDAGRAAPPSSIFIGWRKVIGGKQTQAQQ